MKYEDSKFNLSRDKSKTANKERRNHKKGIYNYDDNIFFLNEKFGTAYDLEGIFIFNNDKLEKI